MNRKRFDFDSIGEAFRAGNRARKKESVQDTIEQPYGPEKTIEDFHKITGYKLTYKDGWYEWGADMRLENRLFSDDNNCVGLKTLPSPLRIKSCLYLKWCNDLETLPDTLEIGGFLSIEYCTKLRSIGEHTKVYTDVYIKGCNSLDRLPLGLRFRRIMHLNDMSAGIVKDTPVVTFVKSLGIEPGKWGAVYAAQWPGNKQPVDEAFRAGNMARRKESVADAVESTSDIYTQKKLFEKETGIKLELKNNRLYSKGLQLFDKEVKLPDYLTVKGNLFIEFWEMTSLPKELHVMERLYLRGCNNLTYLPADLEVDKDICFIPSSLKPFFKKLGIKVYGRFHGGDVDGKEWMEKRHLVTDEFLNKLNVWLIKHGYINEAFRAGNRARKKESVQDTVDSVDNIQVQIDRFREQTGKKLKIKDGKPYYGYNLNLEKCTGLTSLPDGLTVKGDLDLIGCTGLTSLPDDLTVGHDLFLSGCTGLTSLPDDLKVCSLYLGGCTSLTSLPQGLNIRGSLNLEGCTGLTSLPYGLNVNGLDLSDCTGLTSLPRGLTVRSGLFLSRCTSLTSLPQGLTVGGHLNLSGCTGLTSLPQGLTVKWDLDLIGCTGLTSLPDDLKVGGRIIGFMNEAFRAGNRARKKEAAVDAANETDLGFPGTGIDAFDDYFRTIYPTPESIQDGDFHSPENLREFFRNARILLDKQYSIVREDMNMDPCRLDLDWFRWFRGKLREFPQFIWLTRSNNAAESVRSITIPEGTEVLVMRLGVFERLETVRLPDSLKKINVDAFSECCYLKNVRFGGNLETIRTSAFYKCMSLGPIHIPASVRTIEFSAFEESGITEFVMDPDCQVEEIERNLCRLCKSLNRIELGNNVKWIKTLAFAFLGNVDEVILPAGLSQGVIENNAFKNTWIKTVYIKGEDQYDNIRGLSGFESIRQKMLEAMNGGEPEFISIP